MSTLEGEIKKVLKSYDAFHDSKEKIDNNDKSLLTPPVKIASRFLIDPSSKDAIGVYTYTNDSSIKPKTSAADFEYLWTHRANLFAAMLAQRQDMFGLLYRCPRTAYITSNIIGSQAAGTGPAEMKISSPNNLLLGDIDQIMIIAHVYEPSGFVFSSAAEVLLCIVLHIDEIKSGTEISGHVQYVLLSDKDFERDVKYSELLQKSIGLIIDNSPSYVFGPGITFIEASDDGYKGRAFLSDTDHYGENGLRFFFGFAEKICRDRFYRNNFENNIDTGVIRDDIFSAFNSNLRIIPYIIPDDTAQLNERPQMGRSNIERILAIFEPSKLPKKTIMLVNEPRLQTHKYIRVPLKNYTSAKSK